MGKKHKRGRPAAADVINQVGRVAFRHEGEFWHCYYALPDTMEGALLLASIRMAAVIGPENAERKTLFFDLGRSIANNILADVTGGQVTVGPAIAAPEHERSGHG